MEGNTADRPQGREGQRTGREGTARRPCGSSTEKAEVGSWAVGSRVAELREDLGFSSTCREAPGSGAQRCSSIGSGLYKALWLPMGQGWKQTSGRSRLLLHLGRTQVRPEGLALVALGRGGWFSQGHR